MKTSTRCIDTSAYPIGPIEDLKPLCRQLAAEGSVLLKNDGVLPFIKGQKIAVFGRMQETYVKSGTGSGGLVRVERVPCILDSLRENGIFTIDDELVEIYAKWCSENPFDNGNGWASEPWSQVEMPVDGLDIDKFASRNDSAVIIIGRTAGEDKDNSESDGSFRLSQGEEELLKRVCACFDKVVVVLNVGNLIDLSFLDRYPISALLYVWQGGQEGANALADILAGKISPCGKLPDTQAFEISDYPSYDNFGDRCECIYKEDIYVGYRYFETFAPEKVRFPFGFGLTYTAFDVKCTARVIGEKFTVEAYVKNIGDFPSREVVQVYFKAPCGMLGTPSKQLIGYAKTKLLMPTESETLEISFDLSEMASYDDLGVTGHRFAYVLEKGKYVIFAGTDVRSSESVLEYDLDEARVTKQCEQIMPPEKEFLKTVAYEDEQGIRKARTVKATTALYDLDERISERRPESLDYSGDRGIKLIDVADGRYTLDEFVAQMTDVDLSHIVCGEGMNSPKVMVGTGGAFGGVTEGLARLGIPVCCVTDGPSGIRIGGDYKSTSLPNGYVFASSFDDELAERIFTLEGIELYNYNVDALLGPGINIHRHPLCGRNFEYFSEDPLLTGRIAAAQTRGLAKSDCSTTVKHFCCNNQEFGRYEQNVIVSERALREIYLKGFEIAVKEGGARAIMTSYNSVNGYWTASNYDLNTTVLRNEWGFDGFVMTDWWAKCNCKGGPGTGDNLKAMIRAHNDVYMVCESAEQKPNNILQGLKEGYITRGDLQYCAKNLLRYIINSPTFERFVAGGCKMPEWASVDESNFCSAYMTENVVSGKEYDVGIDAEKCVLMVFEVSVVSDTLAQYPITLYADGQAKLSLSVSNGDARIVRKCTLASDNTSINLEFGDAVSIRSFEIKQ